MTVPEERAGQGGACPSCRRPLTLPTGPGSPVAPPRVGYGPQPPGPSPQQPVASRQATPSADQALTTSSADEGAHAEPGGEGSPARPPDEGTRPKRRSPIGLLVVGLIVVLALSAGGLCALRSAISRRSPAPAAPVPDVTSSEPGATTPSTTPGSAATKYDGEWEGATGEGASLSFSVESGSIVFLLLQPMPGEFGPSLGPDPGAFPVSPDGTFHCKGSPGASHSLVFEGRFTSDTEASGACTVDGSETTWQAERKDAEEHSGSPEPSVGTTYDGEWGGQIAASIDDRLAPDGDDVWFEVKQGKITRWRAPIYKVPGGSQTAEASPAQIGVH